MADIESGTVLFERYRIVRVLGEGGQSTVYLAENIKVGSLVAVKAVQKGNDETDLMAEKDLLKELRHPAIPVIIDIEETEGEIYLVEEYVEGVSLGSLKLQLGEQKVIEIMKQLADVLIYLHTSFSEPIIYRDMKPDNIIQMQGGHIKLVDFGIAKKFKGHQNQDTVALGSRGYAAPEQYGVGKTDTRTDIFSLGVCIYYLLTGKNLNAMPKGLSPVRNYDSGISAQLSSIISKCMAIVPGHRYQSAFQLKKDLEGLSDRGMSHKDYMAFFEASDRVYCCAGMCRGVGTTHLTLMLARYFRDLDLRVAALEYHSSEDFTRISLAGRDMEEAKYFFRMEGIDYYPFYHYGGYGKILERAYDVVVVDCGVWDGNEMNPGDRKPEVMMVCGSKDWEIDSFEDYYYSGPDRNSHYLFNLTDEQRYMRLRNGIQGLKCHRVPVNTDPYRLTKEMETMFESVLAVQGQEEKDPIRSADDIRQYIKKVLKKYRQA